MQAAKVTVLTKPTTQASRPLSTQERVELAWMRALFGTAYDSRERHALIDLENDGAPARYWMTLVSSTTLPDGRVAVAVNGTPWNEGGIDLPGIATEGLLNVYLLRREGEGEEQTWIVDERHPNLASMGAMGRIGNVHWVSVGPGKPGFIVSSGIFNRGDSNTYARVYELGNGVRELADFTQSANNNDACTPERDKCWDIEGTIRFADAAADGYADLLVGYSGKIYRQLDSAAEEPAEQVLRQIDETVHYRFDGKAYAIVAGTDPIAEL
ncbi:hypothetical protein [Massilia sp.]|uniref:hypothetical protein n=1 Tax=Massilia sp. TaxID=1882437 RepID=UPI00289C01BC|nr:hypothetical protein [Massilia sp.]